MSRAQLNRILAAILAIIIVTLVLLATLGQLLQGQQPPPAPPTRTPPGEPTATRPGEPTATATTTATPTSTPTATPTASPTPTPTTPPTPTSGPTPFPTTDPRYPDWKGSYWTNMELRGNPALVQNEGRIAFDWGMGSAAAGLPVDQFSARWERWFDFEPGPYTFFARADNGVRFYLDGVLLINEWYSNGRIMYTIELELSGRHYLQVEYYDNAGPALVYFGWEK